MFTKANHIQSNFLAFQQWASTINTSPWFHTCLTATHSHHLQYQGSQQIRAISIRREGRIFPAPLHERQSWIAMLLMCNTGGRWALETCGKGSAYFSTLHLHQGFGGLGEDRWKTDRERNTWGGWQWLLSWFILWFCSFQPRLVWSFCPLPVVPLPWGALAMWQVWGFSDPTI